MSLNNLNRGKIKIVIIVVAVLVLMVIGYFGIKSFPPSMQPQDLIKNSNNEQENTKPVYVAEIPKPIRESTISQVIEAEKGGQIELIDEKGTTISLFVFPGSLKKDTTVSLSLLEKVPITDYVSNMHNGVLIEPESLKFEQPAYLTFDFNPVKILDNPFGFYNKTNILASIVSSVSAASSSEELLPSELLEQGFGVVVVHSNSQSGTVRTEPSASSLDDNSEVNTPVFEGGSYTPDSPNSDKAEDLNNQAAANSNSGSAGLGGPGGCTPERMNTLFSAMANAQAQGIISGEGGVIGPAIKECAKKMVDEIESKCKADRKQLRRREFLGLISVLQTVPDGQPYVERAQKLMKDCVGKYRMLIEGTQYVNEGTIYNKIDATACGYLDDKQAWSGSLRVDISVSIAHQWTDAKVNFTLPSGGGGFGISVNGTHNAPGLISMTVPVNGTIQAYFDGQEKASAKIFSPEIIEGSIKLIDTKCELGGL